MSVRHQEGAKAIVDHQTISGRATGQKGGYARAELCNRAWFGTQTLLLLGLLLVAWTAHGAGGQKAAEPGPGIDQAMSVNGEVALSAFMSLSDCHLQRLADSLHVLADSDAAQSADWKRIRGPFTDLAKRNIPALNWFALPDGSYWSVQHGREKANLAHRIYFPKALQGESILGELVVSKATAKPVAIVAVPVFGKDKSVVGVLGASVYLDKLSSLIHRQMALGGNEIFYSFNHAPLIALVWDPQLIFFEPRKSGDPDLIRAFNIMLAQEHGSVHYTFRGRERSVIFRKSPVTGWWYAFGIILEKHPGG